MTLAGGPRVRIRLPPGESQMRTSLRLCEKSGAKTARSREGLGNGLDMVSTGTPAASSTSHPVFRRAHDMRTQFCTSDHAIPAEILGSRRTKVSALARARG